MWFFKRPSTRTLMLLHFSNLERMMTALQDQVDQLSTELTSLQADVTTLGTAVTAVVNEIPPLTAEVASLQAQIAALQAANPTVDLSGLVTSAQTIDGKVKTITAAAQAAAPAVPGP